MLWGHAEDRFSIEDKSPLSPTQTRGPQPWSQKHSSLCWKLVGSQESGPGWGQQERPLSQPADLEVGHMVSPLGRVQALLQLQMAATRWHRRAHHGQL